MSFACRPCRCHDRNLSNSPSCYSLNLLRAFLIISKMRKLSTNYCCCTPHDRRLHRIQFGRFHRRLRCLYLKRSLKHSTTIILFRATSLGTTATTCNSHICHCLRVSTKRLNRHLGLTTVTLSLKIDNVNNFFSSRIGSILNVPRSRTIICVAALNRPTQHGDWEHSNPSLQPKQLDRPSLIALK